jgi:hypothetical protein
MSWRSYGVIQGYTSAVVGHALLWFAGIDHTTIMLMMAGSAPLLFVVFAVLKTE